MRMYDILLKKREGESLTKEEIEYLVLGAANGSIPDYQLSAFTMAVFFKGMDEKETVMLTEAMAASGDMLDLSSLGEQTVDKHSTGGVGDKTTLIVAPIVASLGGKIAKMSGRGLGHTGGTVDKLEAIPGYRTELSSTDFFAQVKKIGIAVIGQSGNITPADKKLYAIRDVTATVDSSPLICSSVMSKKLAAGSKSIVLDVKMGSGAFMKTLREAQKLSREMVAIGKSCERKMAAVITNMDVPLGAAIGNALEVEEAAAVLKGKSKGDLYEVSIVLAANMLVLSLGLEPKEAKNQAIAAIESGKAWEKFREWITAQGGRMDFEADRPLALSSCRREIKAAEEGFIFRMDAQRIGAASVLLGAGRNEADDSIDYGAGIILCRKTGDKVKKGETLAIFYSADENRFAEAEREFANSLVIQNTPPEPAPLVYDIIY